MKRDIEEFEVVYISLQFTLIYMQIKGKQKEIQNKVFDVIPFQQSKQKCQNNCSLPKLMEITKFMSTDYSNSN